YSVDHDLSSFPTRRSSDLNSINAVMETAKAVNSPVMIQLSNGGAQFYAGKSLNNDHLQACILGGVSAAMHVHLLAEHYGVAVILDRKSTRLNSSHVKISYA